MVGLGLAGTGILLFGVFVMFRAVSDRFAAPDASQQSANVAQPVRQASNRAQVICSLFGLGLGTIASLYMFLAAAARLVETEKAQLFASGGLVIGFLLMIVSALFGMVGLFLRGYALGRVPVYFLIGAGLTFAAVRVFGINMLEWQHFMVQLQ